MTPASLRVGLVDTNNSPGKLRSFNNSVINSHISLNNKARRLEDDRIARENSKMIKRIYQKNSEYGVSSLQSDYKSLQDARKI